MNGILTGWSPNSGQSYDYFSHDQFIFDLDCLGFPSLRTSLPFWIALLTYYLLKRLTLGTQF